ncbi:MAG: nitroreductase family protein [Brevinematia bacterium]
MNIILKRRSIRDYKSKPISERLIRKILLAGMAAPSSWGSKPWAFVVIKNRKILDEIAKRHGYANMCKKAPCVILVCGVPENMKEADFLPQDCAAATENMLLEATGLGLGSVWIGLYPKDERMRLLRELAGVPENVIPFSLVVIGYPNEKKEPHREFYTEKVHYEKWGNFQSE